MRNVLTDNFDVDPALQLSWGKAEVSSLDTRYIDEHGNQHYQLDIDISMIRFRHQQFFSKVRSMFCSFRYLIQPIGPLRLTLCPQMIVSFKISTNRIFLID